MQLIFGTIIFKATYSLLKLCILYLRSENKYNLWQLQLNYMNTIKP